jgi:hypothetical protein
MRYGYLVRTPVGQKQNSENSKLTEENGHQQKNGIRKRDKKRETRKSKKYSRKNSWRGKAIFERK